MCPQALARCWSPSLELPLPPVGPRVCVDERVVRKILKINPAIRQGRTTQEVKQALDRGQSLLVDSGAPDQEMRLGVDAAGTSAERTPPPAGQHFEDALTFFLSGQDRQLAAALDDIHERRQALEVEEQHIRATARAQVMAFVALLDSAVIQAHGPRVLTRHAGFLAQVALSPRKVLDSVGVGPAAKVTP